MRPSHLPKLRDQTLLHLDDPTSHIKVRHERAHPAQGPGCPAGMGRDCGPHLPDRRPRIWHRPGELRPMTSIMRPRPHQREAIDAASGHLSSGGRATVVAPAGAQRKTGGFMEVDLEARR